MGDIALPNVRYEMEWDLQKVNKSYLEEVEKYKKEVLHEGLQVEEEGLPEIHRKKLTGTTSSRQNGTLGVLREGQERAWNRIKPKSKNSTDEAVSREDKTDVPVTILTTVKPEITRRPKRILLTSTPPDQVENTATTTSTPGESQNSTATSVRKNRRPHRQRKTSKENRRRRNRRRKKPNQK